MLLFRLSQDADAAVASESRYSFRSMFAELWWGNHAAVTRRTVAAEPGTAGPSPAEDADRTFASNVWRKAMLAAVAATKLILHDGKLQSACPALVIDAVLEMRMRHRLKTELHRSSCS